MNWIKRRIVQPAWVSLSPNRSCPEPTNSTSCTAKTPSNVIPIYAAISNVDLARHLSRLRLWLHSHHLIFPSSISSPSSPTSPTVSLLFITSFTSSCSIDVRRLLRLRRTRTPKMNRTQLPPLAAPYTKARHHCSASNLQQPP